MERIDLLAHELLIKKKPIPFPISNIVEVNQVGKRYETHDSQFLFYWLYLTGQRISEALKVTPADVTIQQIEGNEFLTVSSITLKNKHQPRRMLPIPFFNEEKPMVEIIWNDISNRKALDVPIFNRLSRTNAWNRLSKIEISIQAIKPESKEIIDIALKMYPHYMRHCRASHLAMFRGYDLYKLMSFFGWSSPAVATVYSALDWSTLAKPFIEVK